MNSHDTVEPRIYVGTYAKYNEGDLTGEWFELSDYEDRETFYTACAELHKDEEDPEFMFQDWENIPDSMIRESWISEEVFELAGESLSDEEYEALFEWLDDGNDYDLSAFRDAWQGRHESETDYAEHLADELGYFRMMENAGLQASYFDVEAFSDDLFCGDYWMSDGGNVFRRF